MHFDDRAVGTVFDSLSQHSQSAAKGMTLPHHRRRRANRRLDLYNMTDANTTHQALLRYGQADSVYIDERGDDDPSRCLSRTISRGRYASISQEERADTQSASEERLPFIWRPCSSSLWRGPGIGRQRRQRQQDDDEHPAPMYKGVNSVPFRKRYHHGQRSTAQHPLGAVARD